MLKFTSTTCKFQATPGFCNSLIPFYAGMQNLPDHMICGSCDSQGNFCPKQHKNCFRTILPSIRSFWFFRSLEQIFHGEERKQKVITLNNFGEWENNLGSRETFSTFCTPALIVSAFRFVDLIVDFLTLPGYQEKIAGLSLNCTKNWTQS